MNINNVKNKKIKKILCKNLTDLINKKMTDKRDNVITITGITISNNLSHMSVFVSIIKNEIILLKFLNNLSAYFRFRLYKTMNLNKIPKIKFLYDSNVKKIEEHEY